MVERTVSDDSVAVVLRRAVGDPASDLDSVLARGSRARRARARRLIVATSVAALAAVIALVTVVALRSQPTAPQPAGLHRGWRSAIHQGTFVTPPLKNAALIRDGFGPAALTGRSTVFTLRFRNGTYRELQAEGGGAPHAVDAGTYNLVRSTVTLLSYRGQSNFLSVRRTNDGFRLKTVHYVCKCPIERHIAPALYTTRAAYTRTH